MTVGAKEKKDKTNYSFLLKCLAGVAVALAAAALVAGVVALCMAKASFVAVASPLIGVGVFVAALIIGAIALAACCGGGTTYVRGSRPSYSSFWDVGPSVVTPFGTRAYTHSNGFFSSGTTHGHGGSFGGGTTHGHDGGFGGGTTHGHGGGFGGGTTHGHGGGFGGGTTHSHGGGFGGGTTHSHR